MKKKILVSLSSFAIASTPIISVVACGGSSKNDGNLNVTISSKINFQTNENLYATSSSTFVLTPEMAAKHHDIHTYITEEDVLNYLLDNSSNYDQIITLVNSLKSKLDGFKFQIAFKDSIAKFDVNIDWKSLIPTVTIGNVQILKNDKDVTMQEGIFRKDLIKTVVRKLMSSLIELKDTLKTNSIDVAAKNTIKEKVKSQTYISGDPKYLIGECMDNSVINGINMIHFTDYKLNTNGKFLNIILQNPSHLFNGIINTSEIALDIFNALKFYQKLNPSITDINYVVFNDIGVRNQDRTTANHSWGFGFKDDSEKLDPKAIKNKLLHELSQQDTFKAYFLKFFNPETPQAN